MRRRRKNLAERNRFDVVRQGRMNIGQRANRALCWRARAAADGRRTGRCFSPTPFQFVKGRVEFSPLAAREETPFQSVLEAVVIFAGTAPGDFRSRASNVQTAENGVMPRGIIRPLANYGDQPAPVFGGQPLLPVVDVSERPTHDPT